MKALKITYWTTTILTGLLFTMSALMYFSHNQQVTDGMHALGYPGYLLNFLGIAKLLAVIALLVPGFPRIREWAYAGLVFDIIAALWSHTASGEMNKIPGVIIPFIIVIISYITWHRLQAKKTAAIA